MVKPTAAIAPKTAIISRRAASGPGSRSRSCSSRIAGCNSSLTTRGRAIGSKLFFAEDGGVREGSPRREKSPGGADIVWRCFAPRDRFLGTPDPFGFDLLLSRQGRHCPPVFHDKFSSPRNVVAKPGPKRLPVPIVPWPRRYHHCDRGMRGRGSML